jgi:diguanylate cyclase
MSPGVTDLLFGCSTGLLGATSAWWLTRWHCDRTAAAHGGVEDDHVSEVLVRLHELATRVAVDVDEHHSQVEEINQSLVGGGHQEPTKIVDVVARLIEANQRMKEKLVSTEDKLREQAEQIHTHAAEARTDALTLLANRRAFDDELARRCSEFHRQGRSFSLVMADVDHFKSFNDNHGHPVGDEVLRGVARQLRRKMREMDIVARYGGEEFAIILPGTKLEDAGRAAARAREAVEQFQVTRDGKELRVTASLGVAEIRGSEEGTALVARTDNALYGAKAGGRNCVYWHDGTEIHPLATGNVRQPPRPVDEREKPGQPQERGQKAPPKTSGDTSTPERAATISETIAELPSRTNFCQQVRTRMAEWKRGGPTLSVALLEVNQFEQNAERRGPPAREFAQGEAVRFLVATIREMDTVGQYAPGCLALLLPTAALTDAIRVAERLREEFARFSSAANGDQSRLTMSVGVAQCLEGDDSILLLKRAEAALDAADRRGGNRAYYHDGDRCAPITAMLETMDYLAVTGPREE